MEKSAVALIIFSALIRLLVEIRILHEQDYNRNTYIKSVWCKKLACISMLAGSVLITILCLLCPTHGFIMAEIYAMGVLIVAFTDFRHTKTNHQITTHGRKRYILAAAIIIFMLPVAFFFGTAALIAVIISSVNVWPALWLTCLIFDLLEQKRNILQ